LHVKSYPSRSGGGAKSGRLMPNLLYACIDGANNTLKYNTIGAK